MGRSKGLAPPPRPHYRPRRRIQLIPYKTISEDYDVLAGNYRTDEEGNVEVVGELVAYRGLFLIDREGIVRHQVVNDMPLGRSIRECLRVVDALQHFEQHGEVCPMDWEKGDQAMTPDHLGVSGYLSR